MDNEVAMPGENIRDLIIALKEDAIARKATEEQITQTAIELTKLAVNIDAMITEIRLFIQSFAKLKPGELRLSHRGD